MSDLYLPSGLSLKRARNRAKFIVRNTSGITLTEALDGIANKELGLSWSKAVAHLKSGKGQPGVEQLMTYSDLHQILRKIPNLTSAGNSDYIRPYKSIREQSLENELWRKDLFNALDQCNKACMFLQHVNKRKNIYPGISSYGLKHAAEHYIKAKNIGNPYISNGAYICASHFMGFFVKFYSDTPNAYFNISLRSPVFEWRKCKDKSSFATSFNNLRKLKLLEESMGLPRSEQVAAYEEFL